MDNKSWETFCQSVGRRKDGIIQINETKKKKELQRRERNPTSNSDEELELRDPLENDAEVAGN